MKFIWKNDILPFGAMIQSDQRALFIEIDLKQYLCSLVLDLSPPPKRLLFANHSSRVKTNYKSICNT